MKPRILIVEDESISLEILTSFLKKDYNIITATNGKEAFNIYMKFNPHIIVTDLQMPVMDGLGLIKKIREIDQNTKIIITSFKNDIDTLLEAAEKKLSKYLIKPINPEELNNIIKESLDEYNNFNTISLDKIHLSDNLIWEKNDFELYHKNELVKLTPKEKLLLDYLLKNPKKVFTYNEIIYQVWIKDDKMGDRKTLKTLITGLRKKLHDIEIENVYGYGYKIVFDK